MDPTDSISSRKNTVWCGLPIVGIIRPFFITIEAGARVTANGDRYRKMLIFFFFFGKYG